MQQEKICAPSRAAYNKIGLHAVACQYPSITNHGRSTRKKNITDVYCLARCCLLHFFTVLSFTLTVAKNQSVTPTNLVHPHTYTALHVDTPHSCLVPHRSVQGRMFVHGAFVVQHLGTHKRPKEYNMNDILRGEVAEVRRASSSLTRAISPNTGSSLKTAASVISATTRRQFLPIPSETISAGIIRHEVMVSRILQASA